ncbi:thioesterase family protein [Phyllobacterium leguminum]|uniref:Putative thioesterase n=1 Tax=Phyllobacterium leguminum TaxID=314237 RepID=A0A318SXN1_9HYPH|nr:hypothetical protein [Phyllobacterium leguminum]PYE85129.1 putative thioesterase [Phyllobacterium leguminum]
MLELKPNLRGSLTHQVKATDLATNWRNDVPVLATPILLWLTELACMRAIEGTLSDGQMTVGLSHDTSHLAPTPSGWNIHIGARLEAIENRKLIFSVEGQDGQETILRGKHVRAIVDRERFLAGVEAKAKGPNANKIPTPQNGILTASANNTGAPS